MKKYYIPLIGYMCMYVEVNDIIRELHERNSILENINELQHQKIVRIFKKYHAVLVVDVLLKLLLLGVCSLLLIAIWSGY